MPTYATGCVRSTMLPSDIALMTRLPERVWISRNTMYDSAMKKSNQLFFGSKNCACFTKNTGQDMRDGSQFISHVL